MVTGSSLLQFSSLTNVTQRDGGMLSRMSGFDVFLKAVCTNVAYGFNSSVMFSKEMQSHF